MALPNFPRVHKSMSASDWASDWASALIVFNFCSARLMAVDPKRKLHYRKVLPGRRSLHELRTCGNYVACRRVCSSGINQKSLLMLGETRWAGRAAGLERAGRATAELALEPFAYLAICINTSVWGHYVISSRPDSYCCSMSTAMSKRDSAAWSPGRLAFPKHLLSLSTARHCHASLSHTRSRSLSLSLSLSPDWIITTLDVVRRDFVSASYNAINYLHVAP